MTKIALVLLLISMLMILSVQSASGIVTVSHASIADVEKVSGPLKVAAGPVVDAAAPVADAAGPAADSKEKSSSWIDWTKDKISGIESSVGNLFSSSSSSSSGSASAPAPATKPKTKV
ncbi:uncharacterized protein LOC120134948 [Hibiscus syriacus]|uniref:uncharacterized protein LOC120134948 n=1 Tax=Hibiscus syriacus TaxID=106335 RepID=UPI0019218CEC|nr:uncharacterized protein LOC120134948 [Hibiscus syriacus]